MKRVAAKILVVGFIATCFAWAQDEDPGRGVARISVMNGDVSIRRGDSGDYVAAAVNGPLVVQDNLLTGTNSRAEVQFDWANMLRLNANTEIRFAELETKRYQVQLSSGVVTHRVLRDTDAEVEINTPSISVRPVKKGSYRIAVLPNGDSEVTVRSGEVEIYSPRGVERLRSGRTMIARGSATDPEFQVTNAIPKDEFDQWNERRDHDLERSRSYQYVSRDIYGAEDLDNHGRWVYEAPYGYVWCPYGVAPGWAPYRAGRWAWVDWYGWTWVSYEPWGWAPYHYGRWFYASNRWCWFPGARHSRHYWAPGLVGFFGWGHGAHVGVGFGSVGWVPLAPYETYHRWYGRGHYGGYRNSTMVNNVRIVNNVNITNVYRNARVHNGITGLHGDEFGRGGAGRGMRASDIPMQRASLVHGAIPVTPGRESLRLSNREVTHTPRSAGNDRFFSRRQPRQVDRVSFEDQRRGMDRMVRGSFGDRAGGAEPARAGMPERTERRTAMQQPGSGIAERSGAVDRSGGWRRMGEGPAAERRAETPARVEGAGSGAMSRGSSESWRRFGGGQPEASSAAPRGERQMEQGSRQPESRQPSDRGNWRRFDGGQSQRESRPPDGGNWRGSGSGRDNTPAIENRTPRNETPRFDRGGAMERRSEPRYESPRNTAPRTESPRYSAPRSEQIRINPPMVRERSTPRAESGGGNRSGGGGGAASRGESRSGGRSEGGRGRR